MSMTEREARIYHDGERLIPGVSHGFEELVRHRSSYAFFRRLIELDGAPPPVRIADLGCGTGHGSHLLGGIAGSEVTGVDIAAEAIGYARERYARPNVTYETADLARYVPSMPEFDYVMSRHAFEHIPGGLALIAALKARRRILIEVPYKEKEGNPHHVMTAIEEKDFAHLEGAEILYQDMDGVIHLTPDAPVRMNSILCLLRRGGLKPVVGSGGVSFPVGAWQPDDPEFRQLWSDYRQLRAAHEASRWTRLGRRLSGLRNLLRGPG